MTLFTFTGIMLNALAQLLVEAGTNAVGARHFLVESLSAQRLLAVGAIMGGVALLARS